MPFLANIIIILVKEAFTWNHSQFPYFRFKLGSKSNDTEIDPALYAFTALKVKGLNQSINQKSATLSGLPETSIATAQEEIWKLP